MLKNRVFSLLAGWKVVLLLIVLGGMTGELVSTSRTLVAQGQSEGAGEGLGQIREDQDAPIPGTPPTLSMVQGTLEAVTQRRTGLPPLPRNSIRYFQGTYQWTLGVTDLEVRVFITNEAEQNTTFLQASSVTWEGCPPREARNAISDDTILLMYQISPEGRWVIFQFPDQDLPICGFIDEFLNLYQFFLRAIPSQEVPQFPAVVGTLP